MKSECDMISTCYDSFSGTLSKARAKIDNNHCRANLSRKHVGSLLPPMVPYGAGWISLLLGDAIRCHVIPYGVVRSGIVPYGDVWCVCNAGYNP